MPRRAPEDTEKKDFLRQLINEKKEKHTRKWEMNERKKMDEMIRQEIERNSAALEARVMTRIGRQYLVSRDEARREELRSPVVRTLASAYKGKDYGDYSDKGLKEIEDEIAMLYELREKKRKGKMTMDGSQRGFQRPLFRSDKGSLDDLPASGETSKQGEGRGRTKVAAGSGTEGVLTFVLAQRKLLMVKNKDQLKVICGHQGVQYTTKAPTIEKIIEVRTKLAYEGLVFVPATPGSRLEEEHTPLK
ncbi:hypothetical protein CBR_g48557 [Chara braunii]|uniref:Uncharacterized protein n=1 Tax=Chara braunii TaxID=69332 RepID=A0A388M2Z0_CHABU|nr:hypothetical protein CBR_g48557 [Chara braunii]|eukprot:GBG88947.1 hypothetical protein CBR_g48557 [Chara braunii]